MIYVTVFSCSILSLSTILSGFILSLPSIEFYVSKDELYTTVIRFIEK